MTKNSVSGLTLYRAHLDTEGGRIRKERGYRVIERGYLRMADTARKHPG